MSLPPGFSWHVAAYHSARKLAPGHACGTLLVGRGSHTPLDEDCNHSQAISPLIRLVRYYRYSVAEEWTIERHLESKPKQIVAIYNRFIELAEACGPFGYSVAKTAITLKGTRRGFAG